MLARVSLIGNWQGFVHEPARSALAEHLIGYAREQRWYRSKATALQKAVIERVFLFGAASESDHCLILLGVELEGGTRETYTMPLRFVARRAEPAAISCSLVAELEIRPPELAQPDQGALLDASTSRVFAELLLDLLCGRRTLLGENAGLSGELLPGSRAPSDALESRFLALEQSNSTILYGSSWLLKLLRRVEPGLNIELEIGRFLQEAVPRAHVPRPVGTLQLSSESGQCTLAVVSEYVENRGSAWSMTLESLRAFCQRILMAEVSTAAPALPSASVAECNDAIPEALLRLADPYFGWVRLLAERTAELHRALGSDTRQSGFGQDPFTPLQQLDLSQQAQSALGRGFGVLRERLSSLPTESAELAIQVLNAQASIGEQLGRITNSQFTVTCIRCHGDYHLGQVLFTGDDFVIIDFEGEPGRPLEDRRVKRSPLRDVAGMLRSFAYAAETALRAVRGPEQRARLAPWVEAFRAWVCVSFVRSYLAGIAGEAYCPASPTAACLLIEFYELEKALYEVDYELNNRPDWLPVPLAGLARIASPRDGR